jgi:hypothetical protein
MPQAEESKQAHARGNLNPANSARPTRNALVRALLARRARTFESSLLLQRTRRKQMRHRKHVCA